MSYAREQSATAPAVRTASRVYVQVWLVVVLIAFIGSVYRLADVVGESTSRSRDALDAIQLLQSQTVTNMLTRCERAGIVPSLCFRVVQVETGFDPSTFKP